MTVSLGTRIFLSSLCVVVFTIGSFLNIALLIILVRSREYRTKISSLYLISLLTSQILACLYESPYFFLSLSLNLPPPPQERYRLACRISIFISYFIAAVKVFNLTLMSLDRYIAIIFPFAYERYVTKRAVTLSVAFVWILPFVFTLPLLVIKNWTGYEGGCGYACGLLYRNTSTVYVVLNGIIVITSPLIIMMFTNIKVYLTARRQQLRINSQRIKVNEKSFAATTFHCAESELVPYTDIDKDTANDGERRLKNSEKAKKSDVLGFFRRSFGNKQALKMPEKDVGKPMANQSYGSTYNAKNMVSAETMNEAECICHVSEGCEKATKSSTELQDIVEHTGSSSIESLQNEAGESQKEAAVMEKRRGRKSVCFGGHSFVEDKSRGNGNSAIDSTKKVGVKVTTNENNSIELRYNESINCADQIQQDIEERCGKSLGTPVPRPTENNETHAGNSENNENSLCDSQASNSKSRSSILQFFEKRRKRKSLESVGSESAFSWSIISSTLLLVLAFFITYMPFLVTRILIANTGLELSAEVITYTALLTTIGNLINPGIIIGTRRKLKGDVMKMVCCRPS